MTTDCERCKKLRELADIAAGEQGLAQKRMLEAQEQRDKAIREVTFLKDHYSMEAASKLRAEVAALRTRLLASEDLYKKSMDLIHEAAGIKRDGLAGILGWIDEAKAALAAERDACVALCEGIANAHDERALTVGGMAATAYAAAADGADSCAAAILQRGTSCGDP